MRIGVLGTGTVGETLAGKLVELGHEVRMGSRRAGNEKAVAWVQKSANTASQGSFEDAAGFGETLVNATSGGGSLDALNAAGAQNLRGKILIDVANPLDFSAGFPPSLSVCNTSSLGERIQESFPEARVVKTLNTIGAPLMVQPSLVPGKHNLLMCGNDATAKAEVQRLLETFGWPAESILDLGGIAAARATEMYVPLWLQLFGKFGTPILNIGVITG